MRKSERERGERRKEGVRKRGREGEKERGRETNRERTQ